MQTTTSPYILPHPPANEEKQWTSDLTPPIPDGNQWLWLGSEEGIIYILKVGMSSLHVSSSLSVDVQSSVLCLIADYERVWAGLANGKLAIFNLKQGISRSIHSSIHPSIYLSIYTDITSIHPFIHPSIHPSIHLSIYPYRYN